MVSGVILASTMLKFLKFLAKGTICGRLKMKHRKLKRSHCRHYRVPSKWNRVSCRRKLVVDWEVRRFWNDILPVNCFPIRSKCFRFWNGRRPFYLFTQKPILLFNLTWIPLPKTTDLWTLTLWFLKVFLWTHRNELWIPVSFYPFMGLLYGHDWLHI